MAEVLIVIAIIGIVAMLTVPSLIANYQKKAWVTQLQKSWRTYEDGMKIMMVRDGRNSLNGTRLQAAANCGCTPGYTGVCYYKNGSGNSGCDAATAILKEFFKITKTDYSDSSALSGKSSLGTCSFQNPNTNFIKNYLADGSVFYMYLYPGGGYVVIDVNGDKKPNTFGRDMFLFSSNNLGELRPYGQGDTAQVWVGENNWNCGLNSNPCFFGCAQRIMDEGWVMNY